MRSMPYRNCSIKQPTLWLQDSQRPELWFSSGDDLEVKGVVAHPDFMHLFDSSSVADGFGSCPRDASAKSLEQCCGTGSCYSSDEQPEVEIYRRLAERWLL